ncbi:MAG: ABC transporter ATP-binding protein [FCB group bacterium]|nr:ABC transporter ATP-binding protein [FCB group bacterium]
MKLSIDRISKKYKGDVWGLKDFSLDINPGILGLLGPNGAGKSTLMRIIATISRPTEGRITWNDVDIARKPNSVRTVLGYLPQDFGIYPHLNPVEFLTYLAAAKGLESRAARKQINHLLEIVNLVDHRRRPLGGFSGGMKQRVGIAQALLGNPLLLIVDEPTAGLDPEERVRFRNLLAELSGERIVILSSHIVSDIEAAATDIAIINRGRLLDHTAPENLLGQVAGKVWEMTIPSSELQNARQKYHISSTIRNSRGIRIRIISDGSPDETALPAAPSMEDAYLYILAENRNGNGQ